MEKSKALAKLERELNFVSKAIDYIKKDIGPGEIAANTAYRYFYEQYFRLTSEIIDLEQKEAP